MPTNGFALISGVWLVHGVSGSLRVIIKERVRFIGVLFGCVARKIDDDSWFTWWFKHLPGISSYSPESVDGRNPFRTT